MVVNAHFQSDNSKTVELEKYFKFKQSLFLRAKRVFYFDLVKKVPGLKGLKRVLNESMLRRRGE